jgi:hypothetical protein
VEHLTRHLRRLSKQLLACLLLAVGISWTVSTPPAAQAAVEYFAGSAQYSTVTSCSSVIFGSSYVEGGWVVTPPPQQGFGMGTFVGQQVDTANSGPKVGDTFYIQIYVAGITQPCTSQAAFIEFSLPSGVQPAITAASPMVCAFNGQQQSCPQSLGTGTFGQYWVSSGPQPGWWSVGAGQTVDIRVPVKATRPISGEPLRGFVKAIDGHASPVLQPTFGMTVFPSAPAGGGGGGGAAPAPFVSYPDPAVENVETTQVDILGFVQPGANGGVATVEIYADPGLTNLLAQLAYTVDPAADGYLLATTVTGADPGTTYYWRVVFQPAGGGALVVGSTQTFTTLFAGADRLDTEGCTETALRDALTAGAVYIDFDCGPNPVIIDIAAPLTFRSPLTVNGDGLVTLRLAKPITVRSGTGGGVTIQNINIVSNGSQDESVPCGGLMTLSVSTDIDNVTMSGGVARNGGAICSLNGTTVNITNSFISGNRATESGGAISTGGNLFVENSEISGNLAQRDGGGAIAGGATSFIGITKSALVENSTGISGSQVGGALWGEGRSYVFDSTISGNRAPLGGGVFIGPNSADSDISFSTIANNITTSASSGAVHIDGASPSLFNSILAGNAGRNCRGALPAGSESSNQSSDATCAFASASSINNADPRLGPLAANGASTRTHALRFGSSAIDVEPDPICVSSDQRGVVGGTGRRPIDGSGDSVERCDLGSFELAPGDFLPMPPARLMDTRPGRATLDGQSAGAGAVAAGSTTELVIGGRGGIPASTKAVALNITAVGASGRGFVTIFPCGTAQPQTANLNVQVGAAYGNASIAKLGTGGRICIFSSVSAQLIVDVTGVVGSASTYTPITPARLLESRPGLVTTDGQFNGIGRRPAGSVTTIQIAGRSGLPAAASLRSTAINVVAVNPSANGFITVYPCDVPMPTAASLNFRAGETIANSVVAKASAAGTICVFTSQSTDLVVDTTGAFPTSSEYIALTPGRLLDTRPTGITIDGASQAAGLRPAGTTTELLVAGRAGVSRDAKAVALNVVAVTPGSDGFLVVYPCGDARPPTSNVNYRVGAAVGNAAVVEIGVGGKVCIFNSTPTHIVVDANGEFPHALS